MTISQLKHLIAAAEAAGDGDAEVVISSIDENSEWFLIPVRFAALRFDAEGLRLVVSE